MPVVHNSKVPRLHLGRKIALSILLLLILAVTGGLWYWNTHKKKIIRNELEKAIAGKSNGLYNIKYSDLKIDELAGDLSITNMNIIYDSIKYDSLIKENAAPSFLFKINIPSISISGVKTPKALIKNEIVGNKLQIMNPIIEIFYTDAGNDSTRYIPSKEIYEQILGKLDLIKIDTAEIKNATIITKNLKKERDSILFKNTNIMLTDVSVDSTANADTTRLFFAKEINFSCQNISWRAKSKLYHYSLDSLAFNSLAKDLTIQQITINPQLSEDAFAKSQRYQSDRFDISLNNITLKDINTQELTNEILIADELVVKSSNIKIYRDLGMPGDNKNRIGTYPHQQLAGLPLLFVIPKAKFSNVSIGYRERNDITRKVGDVRFYNCFINVDNLTNKPSELEKDNTCQVNISMNFLKLTQMKALLKMHIGDKEGRFSVEGSGGNIDAIKLNQLAVPMGMAKVKKGNVKSLHFNLAGNNYRTDGTVTILYDDLNIELLEMNDDHTFNTKHFSSFISNAIIKNANPNKKGEIRIGEVHHDRDMNRSFYNLIWKSIFEGINKTIGNKRKMKRP